ncbi:MAG: TolC family protein [Tannerellaceae bacterium]|jgi:outer membrane protein TolC|nr:TolC family protein [Tannerellaceae bacterium]
MERLVFSKKMMLAALVLLPSLAFTPLKAQEQPLALNLEKALEIAMSENLTVRVAEQEIEKKKYAKKGAYAALFPQVKFGADYSYTIKKQKVYFGDGGGFSMESMFEPIIGGADKLLTDYFPGYKPGALGEAIAKTSQEAGGNSNSSDGGMEMGLMNNWGFGFNAAMPLINASLWKSISISGQDVELAIEQARSSKIDMTNQVKKAYYGVLLANDSYMVFKESYDNATKNYLDIKQKYEQGLVAEYDLIRADVAVRNVEPNMLQAENSIKLVKWQLKALLGMDLDLPIECEGKLTDFESELFGDYMATAADTSLANNTTLKQLDIQNEQLKGTLKLQKFDFIPTLSVSALYNWNAMNEHFRFKEYRWNPYSMISFSLSFPIFTGGSRVQKINQTKVTLNQLSFQRDDLERNLQLVVRQSLDNMTTCVKRYDAAQKGVEQAQRGYMIAQKRYDTGAGTLLEMNDAELAMIQAKLNFNQAIYDYVTAKSDLEKTLGKQAY